MRKAIALPLIPVLALLAGCGGGGSSSSGGSSSATSPDRGPVAATRALSGPVADAGSVPWPQYARDARRSGAANVVGPQRGTIRWQRKLEGAVVPGPAVGKGGTVYAASNGGVLHAIDLKTGKDIWKFDGGGTYGSDLSTTPALLADGTVLWPGPANTLFALSSAGKLLWKLALPAQPLSPAVAADGTVVVSDMGGTVEALKPRGKAQPQQLWRLDLGGTSYASPALAADGTVYVTDEESLVAVKDGKKLWSFAAKTPSEVSPAVAPDGTIVFGSNDSEYGISPQGEEVWRHSNGTRTYSSPIVTADGLAYYGDNHGRVSTLDAATGELLARVVGVEKSPGVWTAPVVDAHHDVYFGAATGAIYGFDAKGRKLFELETGETVDSYPALAADGTLLIGSNNGVLYALR